MLLVEKMYMLKASKFGNISQVKKIYSQRLLLMTLPHSHLHSNPMPNRLEVLTFFARFFFINDNHF